MATNGDDAALEARRKYVEAWNSTMIQIWHEQITKLGVIDTGRLLHSPVSVPVRADGRFLEMTFTHEFLEYGLWQDYGVGREVPRGNPGDIGRAKVRERRRWFSKPYFRSVMNLRDFVAESTGDEFRGIFAEFFNDAAFRQTVQYYRRNRRGMK